MKKMHSVERELHGEIMQIKKEHLVQVTRCTASQTVQSFYCGFQSCCEAVREIPRAERDQAGRLQTGCKDGEVQAQRKEYPFEISVRRSVIVNLIGGLDNNGN
jgi:hypothetical protein